MMKKILWPSAFVILCGFALFLFERSVTFEPPKLVAPYGDITTLKNIGPYSVSEQTPLKHTHTGIDFMVAQDRTPFYAITDGTVKELVALHNPINGNVQVNMHIKAKGGYSYDYFFEPFSDNDALMESQLKEMAVAQGQSVKQGDLMGVLLRGTDRAHVHISVKKYNEDFCFFGLFPEKDQEAMRNILLTPLGFSSQPCYE